MKTITIYDLLGLIKDGKAPKKIKYKDRIYLLNEKKKIWLDEMYIYELNKNVQLSFNHLPSFDEKIEILDEEDEFIEIEKIVNQFTNFKSNEAKFKILVDLINDLVHNQKMLIDKMKEK